MRARCNSAEEYERLYRESIDEPEVFWDRVARELPWIEPHGEVLDWSDAPRARWFVGGKLNASAVCLDQHLETRADKVAILWEGEPGDTRQLTYRELHAEVSRSCERAARARRVEGRSRRYMPMIPELAMAVLACARIGAIHSVVFGGFSAQALSRPHRGRRSAAR